MNQPESSIRSYLATIKNDLPEGIDVRFIFDPLLQLWDVYIINEKAGTEIHDQTTELNYDYKVKLAGTIATLVN